MVKVDMVQVPRAVYEELEEKAIRLSTIETVLKDSGEVLKPFEIKAIMTAPPTGPHAAKVLAAVVHLANIAKKTSNGFKIL